MVTLPIWELGSSSRGMSLNDLRLGRQLVRPAKPHLLGRTEMRAGTQGCLSIIMYVHTHIMDQIHTKAHIHINTYRKSHRTNRCHTALCTYTLIRSYC